MSTQVLMYSYKNQEWEVLLETEEPINAIERDLIIKQSQEALGEGYNFKWSLR